MRVKVKRTEQIRFTWNAQDYGPGDEVDIPDEYAAEYIRQGYVEEVKSKKSSAAKRSKK
jgi:hypothetical protein